MLLLYCIGEGGEKRQQQPPEQKNMYLYIVAVLDIYLAEGHISTCSDVVIGCHVYVRQVHIYLNFT